MSPPVTETLPGEVLSLHVGEPGWVLTRYGLHDPDRTPVTLPSAERGHRLSAAWVDSPDELFVGYDIGLVYRTTDGGESWTLVVTGYEVPDFVLLSTSLRRPVPRQFVRARDGTLYLATVGRGVMRFDEAADAWVDATWAYGVDGEFHPLAWTVDRFGPGMVAGFVSPRGIVPPELTDLTGELVRHLEDPEGRVRLLPIADRVRLVTDVAEHRGRLLVATLGNGIFAHDGQEFQPLGPDPAPADLWAVDVSPNGTVAAVTLSGDVFVQRADAWQRVRCGGDGRTGSDVRWVGERLQMAVGREVTTFTPQAIECPTRGGAKVLLAFSQHTNLYHSYRGDTPDDDGFGKDLRIIRSTIEIFDRHPTFHNDWDIENLFSLDDWLPTNAPDIVAAVRRRVEAGQDGIRLMSWNNGLMAHEPADEFAASVERAKESLERFVPGLWTPGVQPQENMLTPAHPRLYRDHGIEWMTLFYSANSFTSFRHEIPLTLEQAHGVLTLASDLHPETIRVVPVYHHADVMEHGGLKNWLWQLHQNLSGTAVLAIHFDADADSWLGFESELEDVEAMDASWVVPARLQDIVAAVDPVATITIRRDMADGAFDGFASWTEKPVNQRFYTRVARSRLAAERALALSPTPSAAMQAALDDAFEHRLRSLSTTHFGLANPALHPEREAAGDAATLAAETCAATALSLALETAGATAHAVYNLSDAEVTFLQPVSHGLTSDGVDPAVYTLASPDGSRCWLVGRLGPDASMLLTAETTTMIPTAAPAAAWSPEIPGVEVTGPRIRLTGEDYGATVLLREAAEGPGGETITYSGAWDIGTGGSVRYDWVRFAGDPDAWWVEVSLVYPTLSDEERRWWDDAVPLELELREDAAWTVTRRLVTGEAASYEVAEHFDALNNHAAHGWLVLEPSGGDAGVSITHFLPLRSAPAFLPLRLELTDAGGLKPRLAPFGALFGELWEHRARSLLGAGVGEHAARLVSPQLKPTAPAWNGQPVCFLLRIHPATSPNDLDRLDGARDGVLVLDATGCPDPGRQDHF